MIMALVFSAACSEDVCCGCDTGSPGGFQLHPAHLGLTKTLSSHVTHCHGSRFSERART